MMLLSDVFSEYFPQYIFGVLLTNHGNALYDSAKVEQIAKMGEGRVQCRMKVQSRNVAVATYYWTTLFAHLG